MKLSSLGFLCLSEKMNPKAKMWQIRMATSLFKMDIPTFATSDIGRGLRGGLEGLTGRL